MPLTDHLDDPAPSALSKSLSTCWMVVPSEFVNSSYVPMREAPEVTLFEPTSFRKIEPIRKSPARVKFPDLSNVNAVVPEADPVRMS